VRYFPAIAGGVLTALGALWILQGTGVLKGSTMTGEGMWLWIGIVVAAVGLLVLTRGLHAARR
jgi:hypothetical protein